MQCAMAVVRLVIWFESAVTSLMVSSRMDNRLGRDLDKNSEQVSDNNFSYMINSASKPHPYLVSLEINGKLLQIEIDTDACV